MKRIYYTLLASLIFICFPFYMIYGQGARYTGEYTKSPIISHYRKSNFVIEGLEISNTGDASAIHLENCENVIIRNCKFGPSPLTRAIYLNNCKNVTIIDCTFENIQGGLRASNSQGIKFEHNDVTNILGKLRGSNSLGNMVQYINVQGANNSISYNVVENIPGQSSTEDIINIFNSNGTPESPIIVKGNWIRGGGPSGSGGGINLGDGYGSYQIAEDNILVDPGQFGVGIAGGHNMTMRNNKIYGRSQPFTNIGIGACNWYEEVGPSYNITIENNLINYRNKEGNVNIWWFYKNVEPIAGKETNRFDASITASILPSQIIGRARAGLPNNPGNGGSDGGSTPLPGDGSGPDQNENPGDNGNKPNPGDRGNGPEIPGLQLPEVNNHPAISIYLDRYNRVCVNITGRSISANVLAANSKGELIYNATLNRFHNVLPNRPSPGNYVIYVRDGNREHLQTLYIP